MKNLKIKVPMAVAVLIAVVSFGYFIAYAAQVIDGFSDSSKVADTWNVEVDTTAGEVKLATRECDDGTWNCSASTTCSNVLGDGDHIIVANTDLGSQYQWKTSNSSCASPQCESLGGGTNLVPDNTVGFSVYPARDACKAIGGRLPSKTELQCIYNNKAAFGDNFEDAYYWSATEATSNYARRVRFSDGDTNSYRKASSYYVRCVRGW